MARPPAIPRDQRSVSTDKPALGQDEPLSDRRDRRTDVRSAQPGDADVNLDEQGRFGNLKQNLTTHRRV